jgi:hypothetical protein
MKRQDGMMLLFIRAKRSSRCALELFELASGWGGIILICHCLIFNETTPDGKETILKFSTVDL